MSRTTRLVFTAALSLLPACAQQKPTCAYTFQLEQVEASGGSIPVEVYRPTAPGSHPLVFMIHGSAGVFTLHHEQKPQPDNFGEDTFAQHCFFVVLPHYFALTGERSIVDETRLRLLFPKFLHALQEILAVESSRPETRGQTVSVYGESYGGFLAVALAGQVSGIRSVSVYGAGLPEPFQPDLAALPPLLIQHGDVDSIVPPESAQKLQQYWLHAHAPVRLKLYPGAGHYFSEPDRARLLDETLNWFQADREAPFRAVIK